jgi:Putative peptidoglycan binding domain
VLAQDITHDPRNGCDSYKLAEALKAAKDIRTGYVISNRKIFGGPKSPTYGKDPWKWKPYTGTNPHDEHIHHSLAHDEALYDDLKSWDLTGFHAIPDPSAPRKTMPVLRKGAKGFYVSLVQTCLGGSIVDGEFGQMTEQAVLQFQRDHHLEDDGVVGPYTWRELLRPWAKEVHILPTDPRGKLTEMAMLAQKTGSTATTDELLAGFLTILSDILPPGFVLKPEPEPEPEPDLDEQIIALAANSAIAKYRWKNQGVAPLGYTKGLALAFANTLHRYNQGDSSALLMASADSYNDNKDALSWYRSNFKAKGMSNEVTGVDTLRHLYVLLMGLGMRESSGRHCCGIDTSAGVSSRKADTCEAGAWQQSWNSHVASPEIDKLFDEYKSDPSGCLQSVFAEGVSCTPAEWKIWGTGQGAEFQRLAKECPMFAVEAAGVGLRVIRRHWGPINRKEAEIVTAADEMFMDVQRLVESALAVAA